VVWRPQLPPLEFLACAGREYAGSDAPFFDLGSVNLRGIPASRYVGNCAFTLEECCVGT
jgi:hypothetical protein